MATILCVDDEPAALLILRTALDQAGHRCIAVTNVDAAFNVLNRGPVDLIISDDQMPDATGLEFLGRLAAVGFDIPFIMTTSYGSTERAVAAIRAGAIDHVAKPVRPEQLSVVVDQALEFARLQRENAALRIEVRQLRNEHGLLGESPAIQRILELVRTVAPTRAAVLLQGESGTGKELLARAIHDLSERSGGPFIAVSCAPLPEALIETLLFGRASSPAAGAKPVQAAFERARGGTLLLDEVSALAPDLQERLLRTMQNQEFEPAGGGTAIRIDVRIIASTNRDLAEESAQRRFREDLYYRLSVVPIRVPPLRERTEDIALLAEHFAVRTAREIGKPFTGIEPEALARLAAYAWPGNVRELAHAVERAVIMNPGSMLGLSAFDPIIAERAAAAAAAEARANAAGGPVVALRSLNIAEAEAALIERALAVTRNNRTRAAELLGISVRTLRNKLNRELASGTD